ncbi:39326_t:CDS:2 [Gigaspora margarita]|uniref:39326_t:CDS:1 n=1 Tax=Gigaspora margarita TaxID=4874 RepID=A0ABN7VAV6_GIGMA|nr:39326_t:CDS:2 [Gigaspora margarita]
MSSNNCEKIVEIAEPSQEMHITMTNNHKEIMKRNQEIPKMLSNISNSCEEIVNQNQKTLITSSNSSNNCRIRIKWTEKELNALEAGMKNYRTSWKKIRDEYTDLCNRKPLQLKDKAHNEKLHRKRIGIKIGVFKYATGD